MDSVQKFIQDNQHQLGYIMQEASRKWVENDPVGAFVVGGCKATVEADAIVKMYEEQYLSDTIDILYDYDGNRTIEGLKGLINEVSDRLKTLRDHQTMSDEDYDEYKKEYMIVDNQNEKIIYVGSLMHCKGFMKSLYEDDSSNDGLWVWCTIIPVKEID